MIVAFSTCRRDEAIALQTLEWAHSLDGQLPYHCILTVGKGVDMATMEAAARKLFRSVETIEAHSPDTWPQGKNDVFQNLVRHLDLLGSKEPFFWWEPDATPLKRGWLQTIEREHLAGGKPFTGYVHPALKYLECVAVYPHKFMEYSPHRGMLCRAAPWDVCSKEEVVPHAHAANHLFQMVHDVDGFAPTFKDLNGISKEAVIFHKNRDGSLIEQLSQGKLKRIFNAVTKRLMGDAPAETTTPKPKLRVVFPVSHKDIDQALRHATWLNALGRWDYPAFIAFDAECPAKKVVEFGELLGKSFTNVTPIFYETAKVKTYPQVANWAFQQTAQAMAEGGAPFLWVEADAVVLRADWLDVIQREYDACGKLFMGPVVKEAHHGHMNGGAVYPPDAAVRLRRALASEQAWDWASRGDIHRDTHDASLIMAHVWGLVNERPSQTNGTHPPQNINVNIARNIVPPGAVLVHRIKDNSLTDLLLTGAFKPQ